MRFTRLAFVVLLLFVSVAAFASVPPMISYQGKLMQPSGAPVPDGTYSIQFAIYDVPTGGNSLWSETNSSVQVKGGLFSILLGSMINLPGNIFDNPDRFFGVKVGDDPEMTPRQRIASVGYAVKAGSTDIAATVLDASITTTKVAPAAITTELLALGAVTAEKLAPGVAIPPGGVIMWSGAANQIPQGWALCDGSNGTPDLRDRFIVGAGFGYAVGTTGGLAQVTLTVGQLPAHNHGINDPGHNHTDPTMTGINDGNYEVPRNTPLDRYDYTGGAPVSTNTTGITIQNSGGSQSHENRPPYYALCFIMKLGY